MVASAFFEQDRSELADVQSRLQPIEAKLDALLLKD
jgi:hypothetical protein